VLILVLAEAALETVPEELWSHPAVRRHSKRQRKPPSQLILDRSLHHQAMRRLDDDSKRGRPDITHFVLLPSTRLPRNYNRFIGLMEQLFQIGKVPSQGETLLKLEHKTLRQLLTETKADHILTFSREGKPKTLKDAVSGLQPKQRPAVIVGGFPRGHLSETAVQLADELVCVDSEMLEAWTVASRAIYEYEQALSLPKKRISKN
jgi:rRNA small subunit pseudouridine methyltransferase Nep1